MRRAMCLFLLIHINNSFNADDEYLKPNMSAPGN